jgi:hypothetical protein
MGCQDRRRLPVCTRGTGDRARPGRLIAGLPRPVHQFTTGLDNASSGVSHPTVHRCDNGCARRETTWIERFGFAQAPILAVV